MNLVKGLNFVPTFMLEKDASYEEFLNRVHVAELVLRPKGLSKIPHPWLNIWVPRSLISFQWCLQGHFLSKILLPESL